MAIFDTLPDLSTKPVKAGLFRDLPDPMVRMPKPVGKGILFADLPEPEIVTPSDLGVTYPEVTTFPQAQKAAEAWRGALPATPELDVFGPLGTERAPKPPGLQMAPESTVGQVVNPVGPQPAPTTWRQEIHNAVERGGLRTIASIPGTAGAIAGIPKDFGPQPPPEGDLEALRKFHERYAKLKAGENIQQPAGQPIFKDTVEQLRGIAKTIYEDSLRPEIQPQKKGVWGYIANTTFETLPLMAVSTAAAVPTGGLGAFVTAAMAEGEAAYQEAVKKGATEDQAQLERLIVGTINGVIERSQADQILSLGKGVGKDALRQLAQSARAKAWVKLGKQVGKAELKHIARAANEGLEEALQEGVQIGAATIHGDKITWEAVPRVAQAGLGGLTAGYGLTGAAGAMQAVTQAVTPEQRPAPIPTVENGQIAFGTVPENLPIVEPEQKPVPAPSKSQVIPEPVSAKETAGTSLGTGTETPLTPDELKTLQGLGYGYSRIRKMNPQEARAVIAKGVPSGQPGPVPPVAAVAETPEGAPGGVTVAEPIARKPTVVAAGTQKVAEKPQAPIVRFRRIAQSIEAGLPAVPDDHTRLWRGNRTEGRDTGNPSYTNDLPGIALPFAEGYKGGLTYVDVPTADLGKYLVKHGGAPGAEFTLPKQLVDQAKLVPPSEVAAPVAERAEAVAAVTPEQRQQYAQDQDIPIEDVTDEMVRAELARQGASATIPPVTAKQGVGGTPISPSPKPPGETGYVKPVPPLDPRGAPILPIQVVVTGDWQKPVSVEIGKRGRITLMAPYKPFGQDYATREAVQNALDREFGVPTEEGVFYRYTNNAKEISIASRGELRPSVHQIDQIPERGVSVSIDPTYGVLAYKYGYKLTGKVIGTGFDGEPILDPQTIKPLQKKLTPANEMSEAYRGGRKNTIEDGLKRLDWTRDQYEAARNLASSVVAEGDPWNGKPLVIEYFEPSPRSQGAGIQPPAPAEIGPPAQPGAAVGATEKTEQGRGEVVGGGLAKSSAEVAEPTKRHRMAAQVAEGIKDDKIVNLLLRRYPKLLDAAGDIQFSSAKPVSGWFDEQKNIVYLNPIYIPSPVHGARILMHELIHAYQFNRRRGAFDAGWEQVIKKYGLEGKTGTEIMRALAELPREEYESLPNEKKAFAGEKAIRDRVMSLLQKPAEIPQPTPTTEPAPPAEAGKGEEAEKPTIADFRKIGAVIEYISPATDEKVQRSWRIVRYNDAPAEVKKQVDGQADAITLGYKDSDEEIFAAREIRRDNKEVMISTSKDGTSGLLGWNLKSAVEQAIEEIGNFTYRSDVAANPLNESAKKVVAYAKHIRETTERTKAEAEAEEKAQDKRLSSLVAQYRTMLEERAKTLKGKRGKVSITYKGETTEHDATIYGPLAIIKWGDASKYNVEPYSVTHVATGRGAFKTGNIKDAKEFIASVQDLDWNFKAEKDVPEATANKARNLSRYYFRYNDQKEPSREKAIAFLEGELGETVGANAEVTNAIVSKDFDALKSLLEAKEGNEANREQFTRETGVTLPDSVAGTENAIGEWVRGNKLPAGMRPGFKSDPTAEGEGKGQGGFVRFGGRNVTIVQSGGKYHVTVDGKAVGAFDSMEDAQHAAGSQGKIAKPWLTKDKVKSPDAEIEDFFGRTHVLPVQRSLMGIKEWLKQGLRERFVFLGNLPNTKEAVLAKDMVRTMPEELRAASGKAVSDIENIINNTDAQVQALDPAGLDLLRRKVFVLDLLKEAEIDRSVAGDFEVDQLKAENDRLDALMAKVPSVQAAYEARQALWERISNDLFDRGVLNEEAKNNRAYVRHFVLMYAKSMRRPLSKPKKLGEPYRAYKKQRKGFTGDISTDYLAVEIKALADIYRDNAIEDMATEIGNKYDKRKEYGRRAKAANFERLVGGPENMRRIQQLRNLIAESESGDEGRKEWIEELTDMDPTYPFRKKIAMFKSKLEKILGGLPDEDEEGFFNILSKIVRERPNDADGLAARGIFKAIHEREQMIKDTLAENYLTPERLAKGEGYVEWWYKRPNLIYLANTITEAQMAMLVENSAEEAGDILQIPRDAMRQALVLGGKRKGMLIPDWLAAQLNNLPVSHRSNLIVESFTRPAIQFLKRWYLRINPLRYNFRNQIGDLERLNASGQTSALKYLPQATKLLVTRTGETFEKAREYGAVGSSLWHEMNDPRTMREFERFANIGNQKDFASAVKSVFTAPLKLAGRVGQLEQDLTQFREDLLRMAVYLKTLGDIDQGRDLRHWAGNLYEIEELAKTDKYRAAAKHSRETMIDYGAFTPWENDVLRNGLIPFYSFLKKNLTFWPRALKNAAKEDMEGDTFKAFLKVAAVNIPAWLVRVLAVYGLAWLWNHRDDEVQKKEERLAFWLRAQPHVNIGNTTLWGETALNDFAEWVGMEQLSGVLWRYEAGLIGGKAAALEAAKLVAQAPVNKLYQGIQPFLKQAQMAITGVETYPSVFRPRMAAPAASTKSLESAILGLIGADAKKFYQTATGSRKLEDTLYAYFAGWFGRPTDPDTLIDEIKKSDAWTSLLSKSATTGRKPGQAKSGKEADWQETQIRAEGVLTPQELEKSRREIQAQKQIAGKSDAELRKLIFQNTYQTDVKDSPANDYEGHDEGDAKAGKGILVRQIRMELVRRQKEGK